MISSGIVVLKPACHLPATCSDSINYGIPLCNLLVSSHKEIQREREREREREKSVWTGMCYLYKQSWDLKF